MSSTSQATDDGLGAGYVILIVFCIIIFIIGVIMYNLGTFAIKHFVLCILIKPTLFSTHILIYLHLFLSNQTSFFTLCFNLYHQSNQQQFQSHQNQFFNKYRS